MLDTLLLVSCICIVIAIIFYFFHWNRFVAFLIGRGIRLLYWNEESSSIWVEIGSVHFSLVAGRILLKDVTYHSSNQTVKVVKAQLQWRYWIRRPMSEEEMGTILGGEDQKPVAPSMNCRVHVSFQGFEWFLYNRTASYDDIISKMEVNSSNRPVSRSTERRPGLRPTRTGSSSFHPPALAQRALPIPGSVRKVLTWVKHQLPNLDPKDLLPLGIEVIKGTIICGNASTPNLLVAEFQRTEGTFGIVESRSKFDLYKQILGLKFQKALVRYVRNEDYVDPMTTMGELVHGRIIQYSTLGSASSYLSYRSFNKLWRRLGLSSLTNRYSSDRHELRALRQHRSSSRTRKKSGKSAEDATPLGADFSTLEYAIESRILEAPIVELSYYADAVGEVPEHTEHVNIESIDIGNGDVSPEWGFDIIICGGFLRYGPWADRQRLELQRAFFPPTYHDGEMTPRLQPGDKRMWTALRVFFELREGTVLQIPFREASKDWQWDGRAGLPQRQRIREPATIQLNVGDRSSINYTMPMVIGPSGYQPILDIHLDTVVVTSSLNDIRLVTAESCRVRCELPMPLKWNLERKWIVAVSLRQPILYLIREHINMFIDLGRDWAAGPPSDYQRFVPMVYGLEFEMHHFELNMYANDHNIIDKPLVRDENALLTTRGAHLISTAEVPLNGFRQESTNISFVVDVPDPAVTLSLPRWNTNALHAPRGGNSLAKIGSLRINGSYQYFAEVRKEHVEQLRLKFTASDFAFKMLGWSVRYFMVIRENYFGSFTHFSTLYEYLDKRKRNLPPGDPLLSKYREGKSNMLQVELMLCVTRGTLILPAGLPGYEASSDLKDMNVGIGACVVATVPEIQLQLRLHDYYMEMSLNVGAILGGIVDDYPERVTYSRHPFSNMTETYFIDGLDITAHRLFGPQPRTATYVCIWEISLGAVKLLLSASGGRVLVAAGNAFRLNFADLPNAPAADYLPAVDPDITFVKFSISTFDTTWRAGHASLMISLSQGIRVDSNDLGGRYYRKVTSLRIPEVFVKVLLSVSTESNRWLEVAEIVTDAFLDIYASPRGYRSMTSAQVAYVEEQDKLTSRARQMLASLRSQGSRHKNGLYLPQPLFPKPPEPEDVLPVEQDVHTDGRLSTSWPVPSIGQLYESDTEEGVSEADRDARLAKTRSSSPIAPFVEEDSQDLASGDESDNEDLTDASSESDWFEFASSSYHAINNPLLMRYTRHYIAHHLETPILWDRHPFVLAKDSSPLGFPQANLSTNESRDHTPITLDGPLDLNHDHNLDSTSYRFRCRHGVNIKITPLILVAATQFEADRERNPLGPELCIDSLMAKYFSGLTASKDAESCTLFEVSVPLVAVHIFQVIVMVDGHPTISREIPETEDPAGIDVISVVHGEFTGVVASGILTGPDASVKTGFDCISLTLDISNDEQTFPTALFNDFVLSYVLHSLQAEFVKETLDVTWGKSILQLGLLGPEYLTATCIALARHAKQLGAVKQRWDRYASASTQTIVSDILQSSANNAILDPLSVIQPSYLVQTGAPQKLRTDTMFRLLFHLRNCLRQSRVNPSRTSQDDSNLDFISLLESRLEALDQDAYPDTDLSFLQPFFPGLRILQAPGPGLSSNPLNSMSVQFARLAVIVLDPHSQPSELAVTDVQLSAHIRKLEVLQLPATHPSSMSQTSLKDRHSQSLVKTSATILFGDVTFTVFPHLMQFAQNILWVRRHYCSIGTPVSQPPTSANRDDFGDYRRLLSFDITWSFRRLRIQAAAENLIFEFGVSDMRGASLVLLQSEGQRHQSMNHSTLFSQIYIRAHSPADMTKQSDQDILASLELTNGKLNTISRQDLSSKLNLRVTFAIGGLQFSVPRSALRLYRFVEEWRADYLPGIEATAQALLSELQRAPAKPISQTTSRSLSSRPIVQVQGHLLNFGISLQVMHGTWLSWEANRTTAYFNSSNTSASSSIYTFGLQVAAMNLIISSNPNMRDVKPTTRVKLVLPPLSITGHFDGTYVYALALIDFVELKVKPSHWDTLLAVQQKFGQDFNDLVTLVQETHSRQTATSGKTSTKLHKVLTYNIFLKIRGFRVGLEGRSSTVHLECLDIGGGVNNVAGLVWNIDLSDLAFSLAPQTAALGRQPGFSRKHCSAFVIVDFMISAGTEILEASANKVVLVSITKIHAVMQPSSIGEVGDFIDHLQAEMLVRKEQRALELAAFKEKAQSILKTFEIGSRDTQVREKSAWLDNYVINVSTRNIGVAFPLIHDQDLELPQIGSRDSTAVRAFLFSIKLVEFGTHRGETGQATMQSLSFQFVPGFRQSVASDFSGENHRTRNRLLYPEMKAQLRSTRSGSSRNIWVKATVSGFILDLDSSIPSYVFSLVDVYHQGKTRMAMFSATAPHTPSNLERNIETDFNIERRYTALPTSCVFASLTFLSGKVRVYSRLASNLYRTRSFSQAHHEPSDEQVMELGAEVFNLPAVSVWAEYRSTPASRKIGVREAEPSILMFKCTVHSSQNTLRPTLLPFLTELVSHVEARLRKASLQVSHPISADMSQIPTTTPSPAQESLESVSTMRISFSLRIDQSKLELTCQPDVNVLAGLHWDSGGFVVNMSPGARDITFTGIVGGLTLGLKHGFLSEDCVKLDARNLAFSLTFSKTSVSSVSLILDTEFLGVVRFSRLQDILCFKAVWLDRIPIFTEHTSKRPSSPTSSTSQAQPPFSTIVLVRIRQIKLDVDLGQSISAVTLDLAQAVIRTKLTELRGAVSIFVTELTTVAKGNIAGHAHVANCVFQTIRNAESNALSTDGHNRMLELRMTSGPLTVALESDNQKLLHYRAEPLEIKVFDDWTAISGEQTEEKPLRLSFTVTSPEVIAVVTVGTIPKLMSYGNKFTANLDAQRQGASRESKAFRVTRTPKPENPLSAVAEAMLHSARSHFKEAESGFSHAITQYISLHLDSLRLVVFPRTMDDLEIAQFTARDVSARLDRLVQWEAMPGERDLFLSFSSMIISKFSGLGHPQSADLLDVREWLASLLRNASEAIIVGLPSMTMHMVSEETVDDLATNLVYDFHSLFVRREGMKDVEDIYITLNVALYSWLTLLRKNLTREMDQVKATTDWRALLNTPSGGTGGRKKVPSALNLLQTPKSPMIPDSDNKPFSPFSPTTALKSTLPGISGSSSPASPSPSVTPDEQIVPGPRPFPSIRTVTKQTKRPGIVYRPRSRHIERLTMRQLGEATPDVMHPFFMKKAGFNLEDSLPQYVNEYAIAPLEEVMEVLLKLYSRQLLAGTT